MESAADKADFWHQWQRFFGEGKQKTVLGAHRFESYGIGEPESALGESLLLCLPGVEGMLSQHLRPAGIFELNAPEFCAVWKIPMAARSSTSL